MCFWNRAILWYFPALFSRGFEVKNSGECLASRSFLKRNKTGGSKTNLYLFYILYLFLETFMYKLRLLEYTIVGVHGGAIGWGIAPQAGRSPVRFPIVLLEFFFDVILPSAIWPWGRLSLQQKLLPGIFPGGGGKGGRCVELTTLSPSCAHYLEILEFQPSETLRACQGL
jgi:hypothetical protein